MILYGLLAASCTSMVNATFLHLNQVELFYELSLNFENLFEIVSSSSNQAWSFSLTHSNMVP